MKKIIGKKKCNNDVLRKNIILDKIEINDDQSTGTKFFIHVGPNLATNIQQSDCGFISYFTKVNTTLNERRLAEDEFGKVFKSFKRHKYFGTDGLDVNHVTSPYEFIEMPLQKISNESLTKVAPIFKSRKKGLLTNYSQASAFSCFSKILERIIYK